MLVGKLKILASSFLLLFLVLYNLSNIKYPLCHVKKLLQSKNFMSYGGENEGKVSHKCCKGKSEESEKQNLIFDYQVFSSALHSDCCSYNKICCSNFSTPYALHQKESLQDLHPKSFGLVSEISKEILSIKDKFHPPRQL